MLRMVRLQQLTSTLELKESESDDELDGLVFDASALEYRVVITRRE